MKSNMQCLPASRPPAGAEQAAEKAARCRSSVMDGVEAFTDGVEVLPSKLGGLGLFARRAFAKGDALLVERPFLRVGSLSRHQQWHPAQAAPRAIEEQVALLPDAQREEFWKFGAAPVYGQTPSAHGIFFTNCIDATHGASMYLLTSRLNHACVPNVSWRCGAEALMTVAVRDIQPGEELLVSYMRHGKDSHGEVISLPHYLQHWYGFSCACGHCAAAVPRSSQTVWAAVLPSNLSSESGGGRGQLKSAEGFLVSTDPDEMVFI